MPACFSFWPRQLQSFLSPRNSGYPSAGIQHSKTPILSPRASQFAPRTHLAASGVETRWEGYCWHLMGREQGAARYPGTQRTALLSLPARTTAQLSEALCLQPPPYFAGWSQSDPCWLAQAITAGLLGPQSGGELHTQDVEHSGMRLEMKGPAKFFAYNNSSCLTIMTETPTIKVTVRTTQKSNIL